MPVTIMANVSLFSLLAFLVFFAIAKAEQVEVMSGNATITTRCDETQMTVIVKAQAGFAGKVYAQNFESSCAFIKDATDPTLFNRSFSYQLTDCGQTATTNTANNSREFSVTIVVQYSPDVMTSSDTIHTSSCVFDSQTSVWSQPGTVNRSDANLGQSESSAEGDTSTLLDFTIQKEDGTKMDNFQVPVGEKLILKTALVSDKIFSEMLVMNCRASNRANMTDTDYVSVNLLDDSGCPANASVVETLDLVGPSYQKMNSSLGPPRISELEVNAFLFLKGRTGDSNQLVFFCDVLLCSRDNADSCGFDLNNCSFKANARKRRSVDEAPGFSSAGVGQAVRQRRSAVADQGTKLTTVHGSIQVVANQDSNDGAADTQPSVDSDQCLKNGKTQAILVAMGVLLLASLLVIITLIVILCRRRRRVEKAKQMSDDLSMGSSRQTLAPDYLTKFRG